MRILRTVVALCLLPMLTSAQGAPSAGAQRATRAELAQRLQQLENQLGTTTKADQRSRIQAEQAAIRQRLEAGDFRVGDRFVMTIRFDSVRVDTASVRDSMMVSVLNLPDLRLNGVLRSELDERLNQHVAKFIRNATVRSNVLTRIAVLGSVMSPGYYYASPDRPVSDIVMLAGGPAPDANIGRFELKRGTRTIVDFGKSKALLESGRTLEQLDVQSGDEFRIQKKRKVNWQMIIQLFFIISSLMFALVSFLQWYYDRQE